MIDMDDDEGWAQLVLENRRLAEEMGFTPAKWGNLDWIKPKHKETGNEISRETL
jgi:hypothetical protein